jgi:acetyltransferase-like isoleucine patch superfamily enzyme
MRKAGRLLPYRLTVRLATVGFPPFYSRIIFSRWNPRGYISPNSRISHADFILGSNCFLDDAVLVFQDGDGGSVKLGDGVHVHHGTFIQTGAGGAVSIGANTHLQPRCQLSAYAGRIEIGDEVEIAPGCAFYPYNHGTSASDPVRSQPLESRGGIQVGNRAWLGYGVIVLDGVSIGEGAVIGAGSVVTRSIRANTIAAGNPAKVIRER